MDFITLVSLLRMELLLTAGLVVLLIYKIFYEGARDKMAGWFTVSVLLGTFLCGIFLPAEGGYFGGMFITGSLAGMEKSILSLGSVFIILFGRTWLENSRHELEFYLLILSVLLGMFFMISAGHLLMFYLGLELATLPLAALAVFDFNKSRSSEAGVKLILNSAFSSALLLFGASLVYGGSGTLYFPELNSAITFPASRGSSFLLLAGFSFLFTGFAFKISAVPFHLWTADVYEGAPVPVTAFLSVISKGAALFVFVAVLYRVFPLYSETWSLVTGLMGALTMVIGNLFAMRQGNLKRFLAFSSITQVGFLLVGVASASQLGHAAVLYFMLIYLFSNLGAFAVVSVIADKTGKETLSDYRGLYKTNPMLALALLVALFSLAGIPPTAGFFGKLFLLNSGASSGMIYLVIFACMNMVVSLYYYLRVVKAMFVDTSDDPIPHFNSGLPVKIVLACSVLGIILLGFFGGLFDYFTSLTFGLQ
jgi:NADH-quinone oxidoreductase subunit N